MLTLLEVLVALRRARARAAVVFQAAPRDPRLHALVALRWRCRLQDSEYRKGTAQLTTHVLGPLGPGRALGAGSGPAVALRPERVVVAAGPRERGERRPTTNGLRTWLGDRSPRGETGPRPHPDRAKPRTVFPTWEGSGGGAAGVRLQGDQPSHHSGPDTDGDTDVPGGLRGDGRSGRQRAEGTSARHEAGTHDGHEEHLGTQRACR